MISFITCTKEGSGLTLMETSLRDRDWLYKDCEVVPVVGASSIAQGYNAGVKQAQGDILVFLHDDVEVWAAPYEVIRAADTAKSHEGVIGVAGATKLASNAVWWHNNLASDIPVALSGACMHTKDGEVWMSSYGRYGKVEVLDGVFLMCSRKVYDAIGGFDESLPGWDFYDIDFTLKSAALEFMNRTYPIHVLCHHSLGDTSQKPWEKNRLTIKERRAAGYYEEFGNWLKRSKERKKKMKHPKLIWQINDEGHHRLVEQGKQGGAFSPYDTVTKFIASNGHAYVAVTEYYAGVLPTEQALAIEPIVTTVERLE